MHSLNFFLSLKFHCKIERNRIAQEHRIVLPVRKRGRIWENISTTVVFHLMYSRNRHSSWRWLLAEWCTANQANPLASATNHFCSILSRTDDECK